MKLFILREKKHREVFTGITGEKQLPLFGLTNSFLTIIGRLELNSTLDSTEEALGEWTRGVLGKEEVDALQWQVSQSANGKEKLASTAFNAYVKLLREGRTEAPVLFKKNGFCLEYIFIEYALHKWLVPTGKGRNRETPSQKYSKSYGKIIPYKEKLFALMSALTTKDFNFKQELWQLVSERNKQFLIEFVSVDVDQTVKRSGYAGKLVTEKPVFAECYTSNNLLPLAWAEIMYAVKNDIFALPCGICGQWFPLEKGKYNQKYCSPECLSESKRRKITSQRKASR